MSEVNSHVNLVPYVSDFDNYGVNDYHASPEEFYTRGGDCEDYARAKYELLLKLGFSSHQFSYVIVNTKGDDTQHAVLALHDRGKWYFLDNNVNRVYGMGYLTQHYNNAVFINTNDLIKN